MPRGRKKADIAPQDLLNEVLASIEETEQKLKALRTQKKDIEKQIEAKEMAELYAIVKEKNMSIEDVKTKLGAEKVSHFCLNIKGRSTFPGYRGCGSSFFSILPVPRNYRIHADLRQIPIILILLRSTPRSYSPFF